MYKASSPRVYFYRYITGYKSVAYVRNNLYIQGKRMLRLIIIFITLYAQSLYAGTISYSKELSPDSTCTQSAKWNQLENAIIKDGSGITINAIDNEYSFAYQDSFPALEAGKTYLVSLEFKDYQGEGNFELSTHGSNANPQLTFDAKNGIQEHLYRPAITEAGYGVKRQYGVGNLSATLKSFSVKEVNPILDATLYTDKPSEYDSSFPTIRIIYGKELWEAGESLDSPDIEPNIEKIKEVAARLPKTDTWDNKYILDIEIKHWISWSNDENIANSAIDNLITIIRTLKEARPDLEFGFYDIIPHHNYWGVVGDRLALTQYMNSANKRIERLLPYVDFLAPEIYAADDNQEKWKRFAEYTLKRAQEYSGNKPVYAFVWPRYNDDSKLHENLSDEYWKLMLETSKKYADGTLVWGGWDMKNKKRMIFNENDRWWIVLKSFIE
ncbi:MAG: hypothetical protein P8179_16080 [Candidatus Thiodiazotropha sp.]|jgi:hypothetical protein